MNRNDKTAGHRGNVPLTEAAAELGMSYHRALRLVLIGHLKGKKIDGHWMVDRDALARATADAVRARGR